MICDWRFTIYGAPCNVCRGVKLATLALALFSTLNPQLSACFAFEGRISAVVSRGTETTPLLYTAGTNDLRVEVTETSRPHAVDLFNRSSGEWILLFPHNRSFVRLKPAAGNAPTLPAGFPAIPAMPPGVGPQTPSAPSAAFPPGNIGPTNFPGMPAPPTLPQMPSPPNLPPGVGPQAGAPGAPALPTTAGMSGGMPAMPMMPPPMMEAVELKSTGENTNLLGLACEKFEIRQRGEVMEIWATSQLLPFQPYLQNQPPRFGPRMIEEQWPELLKAKKLFPLLASLKFENGAERLRFEVKSVTPEKIEDHDGTLFQPPADYQEIQPLPF